MTTKNEKSIVTVEHYGVSAIILVITQDLTEAYKEVMHWVSINGGSRYDWKVISISAQAVQINSQIIPQGVPGLAVTALCEKHYYEQ